MLRLLSGMLLLGRLSLGLLCLLALLHLLLLGGALLLSLLTLRLALLLHLLAALLGLLLLRRPLLDALLFGLLALGIALLAHLLTTLLGATLLNLSLLRHALLCPLLLGLLALRVTLLPHLLAALLCDSLLGLLLLSCALLGTLLLRLLTHLLAMLGGGALRFHHMLTPRLIAAGRLLLQPLLHRSLLVGGSALAGRIALGIGLRTPGIAHLLSSRLLLLALLGGALLFRHRTLLRPITLRLLACLIGLSIVLASVAAIVGSIELWRPAGPAAALPCGEAFGGPLAGDTLGHQLAAFLGGMALTIGLPVGLALARLAPVGACRSDHRAACRPLRRGYAAPLALPRCDTQRPRAGIIAGSCVGLALRLGRGQIAAPPVIDAGDPPVAIAIAVIGIAHEIGVIGARLVIIIAIAVVDRLGIGQVIVAGLPDPGLDAVIVETIIRRRIADRIADPVGPVDPGIAIVIGRLCIAERPRDRQARRRRRISHRCCWPLRQRLDLGQRRKGCERLGARRIIDARLPILLPAGSKDKGERGGAGETQRDACLSGHGECSSGG